MDAHRQPSRARLPALMLTFVAALVLAAVVLFGLAWITVDWNALECFEGDRARSPWLLWPRRSGRPRA